MRRFTGSVRYPSISRHHKKDAHGTHTSPSSLSPRCSRACDEQRDARVPPRQAPQRLRREPEQPAERHRVRIDAPRGHHQEVIRRRVQQRGTGLEPHLLLELPEASGRRRTQGRIWLQPSRLPSGAVTLRSRKRSSRAQSATSVPAGPGWSRRPTARSTSCQHGAPATR